MKDLDFEKKWELFKNKYEGDYINFAPDPWRQHIIDHIHTLPDDVVEKISNRLPDYVYWSDEVVAAAQGRMAELYLLEGRE